MYNTNHRPDKPNPNFTKRSDFLLLFNSLEITLTRGFSFHSAKDNRLPFYGFSLFSTSLYRLIPILMR